jgi:hypothetical protein
LISQQELLNDSQEGVLNIKKSSFRYFLSR